MVTGTVIADALKTINMQKSDFLGLFLASAPPVHPPRHGDFDVYQELQSVKQRSFDLEEVSMLKAQVQLHRSSRCR